MKLSIDFRVWGIGLIYMSRRARSVWGEWNELSVGFKSFSDWNSSQDATENILSGVIESPCSKGPPYRILGRT